jgi:nucleotide-binding universal stress UspA family protein
MNPTFVVLTDASPADEPTLAYAAALAAPLGASLHLVHVLDAPLVTTLNYGPPLPDASYVQAVRVALTQAAARLTVPTTIEVVESSGQGTHEHALATYQPALLIAGLTATDGPLSEWLNNRALPLAHQTGYPLLLVPEYLPKAAVHPPRRVVLAVEDHSFKLTSQAQALAHLLDKLACPITPVMVLPPGEELRGEIGLRAVQQCGLAANLLQSPLHRVLDVRPSAGIWQAADEAEADLVILLDQGHGWVHKLFSGSVIADVLRYSQVPVLLLPLATA